MHFQEFNERIYKIILRIQIAMPWKFVIKSISYFVKIAIKQLFSCKIIKMIKLCLKKIWLYVNVD